MRTTTLLIAVLVALALVGVGLVAADTGAMTDGPTVGDGPTSGDSPMAGGGSMDDHADCAGGHAADGHHGNGPHHDDRGPNHDEHRSTHR